MAMNQFIILTCSLILIAETAQSQGCIMIRNISDFGQYNLSGNSFLTSSCELFCVQKEFNHCNNFFSLGE